MKKIFVILAFVCCNLVLCQDLYSFKSGGRISYKGEIIEPTDVRNAFADNKTALELYNTGRSKKTWGNILLYSGIMATITTFGIEATKTLRGIAALSAPASQGSGVNTSTDFTATYISFGVVLAAIPIKIGFSKKIKKAVILMNQDLKNPTTSYIKSTAIIANGNGIGISVKF